jgi:hypothetical protein
MVDKFGSGFANFESRWEVSNLQNFVRRNADGHVDANAKKIINVADPEDEDDVATARFVREEIDGMFDENVNARNHKITNLGLPTHDNDAVTKSYSDMNLSKGGGRLSGHLDMDGNELINVPDPIGAKDCVNKQYADSLLGRAMRDCLLKSGDQMLGELDMDLNRIANVGPPRNDYDCARKKYVDGKIKGLKETCLLKDVEIDANDKKIINVGQPTNDKDCANKMYVDTVTAQIVQLVNTQIRQLSERIHDLERAS